MVERDKKLKKEEKGESTMKKLLITLIITMAVCVSAQATVQYSADFESPAYSIGPVNGQNGWIGSDPHIRGFLRWNFSG